MNITKKFEFTPVSRTLLIIIIACLLSGFCSVLSASLFTHSYDLVYSQFRPLVLGIAVCVFMLYFDMDNFLKPLWITTAGIAVTLLQILPLFLGQTLNGASRWVFGFQASDVLSLYLIFYAAFLCSADKTKYTKYMRECETFKGGLLYIIAPAALVLVLVGGIQKNFSTAVLQVFVFFLILFARGLKFNIKLATCICIAAVLGTGILLVREPYRINRLANWINHDLDIMMTPPAAAGISRNNTEAYDGAENTDTGDTSSAAYRFIKELSGPGIPYSRWDNDYRGYVGEDGRQAFYSKISVISGGIAGKGPAGGRVNAARRLAISESDYIFSVLCSELGFFVITAFLCMAAWFIHRGLFIRASGKDVVLGSPIEEELDADSYLHTLATGVVLLIAVQSLFHIWVNLSLFPVTGIPLPLISNGGSSKVITLAMLGILLNATCDHRIDVKKNRGTVKKIIIWISVVAGVYVFAAFTVRFIKDFVLSS